MLLYQRKYIQREHDASLKKKHQCSRKESKMRFMNYIQTMEVDSKHRILFEKTLLSISLCLMKLLSHDLETNVGNHCKFPKFYKKKNRITIASRSLFVGSVQRILIPYRPSIDREIFVLRVEEFVALSENSLIDHRNQLAVEVSVNVIREDISVMKTTTKNSFEMQWWVSKRVSLVRIESGPLCSFSLASSIVIQ